MKRINIQGARFGYLTVGQQAASRRGRAGQYITCWVVLCDCGNEKIIQTGNLTRGRTQSCGENACPFHQAAMRGRYAGERTFSKESGLRWLISFHKGRAKRDHREFDLSDELLTQLFAGSCFLCGAKPANRVQRTPRHEVFLYSGIDRVDSSKGYVPDNVRSCCWNCNRMKGALSDDQFLSHIKAILKHQKGKR